MVVNTRRLPMGWKTTKHECDIPFAVYFTPELGDIWECGHCRREWEVNGISTGDLNTYRRYLLSFRLIPNDEIIYRSHHDATQ